MSRAAPLTALAGLFVAAGHGSGQETAPARPGFEVVVELGPDPDGSGPPALVWLRDELVPASAGWPRDADPRGPVRLTFGADLTISARPNPESLLGSCELSASIRAGGRLIATSRGHGRGNETIELCAGADLPALASELGVLLGSGPGLTRDVSVDLPSLLGAFSMQRDGSEPRATQLALLAAHIGEVRVEWRRQAGTTVLNGQSAGGLVVPLSLACVGLANARADRTRGFDEGEALAIRAQALRSAGREEAARQLARIGTPGAREVLLRLCRADEYTRVLAMESLARRGDPSTLPALVEAATDSMPESIEIARDAMLAQWNWATQEQRESLLSHLRSRREPGLRDLPRQLEGASLATQGGASYERAAGGTAAAPSRFWLLLPLALGMVLLRAIRDRHA